MSDTEPMIPVLDPDARQEQVRAARVANIAKARQAKTVRSSTMRQATTRQAPPRDAEDAGAQGVGSHAGPAKRAEPAREEVSARAPAQEVIRRVKRNERDLGWADLPEEHKKPGRDYEWKTIRVFNEPVDDGAMLVVRNAGWRPEMSRDWPSMVEPGTAPDKPIERQGQRLYGRPMYLTNEAKHEDLNEAQRQQREKMQSAATGQTASANAPGIPNGRATRAVPIEISIMGEVGS